MVIVLKANLKSSAPSDVIWQQCHGLISCTNVKPWHPLWHSFKIIQDIISKRCIGIFLHLRRDNELRYFIIIIPQNRYMSYHKGNVAFLNRKIIHYIIVTPLWPQQILTHFLSRHNRIFYCKLIDICSNEPSWQCVSINSNNNLSLKRRYA